MLSKIDRAKRLSTIQRCYRAWKSKRDRAEAKASRFDSIDSGGAMDIVDDLSVDGVD